MLRYKILRLKLRVSISQEEKFTNFQEVFLHNCIFQQHLKGGRKDDFQSQILFSRSLPNLIEHFDVLETFMLICPIHIQSYPDPDPN